ncbi:MAG: precorrin-6y C5,15-methyltransferase (decarboxylating) subunit CbiE [Gluconacetobacter diazotrophicus]|nr:precorrin-6y C5,15-methyltransferase (decarboxylating) subunit CbiE [Gluconacetobacter diazotrophicus]
MTPWLSILGIGEDGLPGMTAAARTLLGRAELVVGGARHLAMAGSGIGGKVRPWPSPMAAGIDAVLAERGRPVAVLASGDPFCFGVGTMLTRSLAAGEWRCIPAASAAALARSRLGWSEEQAALRSVCGRPVEALLAALRPGARLLVLSADESSPAAVAALLARHGYGRSRVHVLERLGGDEERIRCFVAEKGAPDDCARLNLLAIEAEAEPRARRSFLSAGLPDAWFEHDGQITKREVRAVTLAMLRPSPGDLLWDLGAGSGSVGIEWMLRDPRNRTVAVERRADRAAAATRNALAFGVPELDVIVADAAAVLPELPPPDAIFLGGGIADGALVEAARAALRPEGVLVANAVSVDGEAVLLAAQKRHGGTLRRLGVERLDRVGSMRAFRPAMTVTQWVLDEAVPADPDAGRPW